MTSPSRDPGAPPRTPRWVKVAAIVVGIVVLILVALQVTGVGGRHGPGRHGMTGSHAARDAA